MSGNELTGLGFEGFAPLRSLPRGAPTIPDASGVYAVLGSPRPRGAFIDASTGGHFKGKNPSTDTTTLTAKWVPNVEALYIGRGGSLRDRIDQLARFGRGEPVGHWGGRYLWQLAGNVSLRFAWRIDPDPVGLEAQLIDEFVKTHSALPFANIQKPRVR